MISTTTKREIGYNRFNPSESLISLRWKEKENEKSEVVVAMANNNTSNVRNESELLPFAFLNDLINQKIVIRTSAGDYVGTLKGWDEQLNVVLADVAELKEMELIRTHKTILIRGGDVSHITPK
jgi:small nuclear ribonucleoprotein (snRNP)-like protein